MAFTTDQQTLNDLTIFGRHGGDSVYGLFNRTVTRNGAALLEEMFRHPLSDAAAIQQRSAAFQYFLSRGVIFPFRSELFDIAEYYLSVTDERTRLSAERQTLGSRITGLVAEDNEYKHIYKGVTALVEIVQGLHAFVGAASAEAFSPGAGEPGVPLSSVAPGSGLPSSVRASSPGARELHSPYREEKEALGSLLAGEALQSLLEEDLKSRLPFTRIVAYDGALRFRHRVVVRRLLQCIYRLDVHISVGRVAAERNFSFPLAHPSERRRLYLQGVYHPLVPNAVPNTLEITPDNHVLFLTGANMAGKSTFMKALGISLFLAHMGFPVPAARMEFSVLDGMYTTINLPDNLGMGASHFYAEVLRVKKVAKELGGDKKLFVLFDELFRGTNVKDAYEATVALTSAFAGRNDSIFVISTHIIEAGEVLTQQDSHIRPLFLPTRMEGTKPVYTYTLEKGITADRHGMIIIENEGIPGMLQRGSGKTGGSGNGSDSGRSSRKAADNDGGSGNGRGRDGGLSGNERDGGGSGFMVDRQTLDDLNLTGKYKPGSVYSLFNQVRTAGGERLLEEWFNRPLCDAEAINRRSGVFRYLQDKRPDWPFSRGELGRVEDYLRAGAGHNPLMTMAGLLRLKLLESLIKDERYPSLLEGVAAVISLIPACRQFLRQFRDAPGPLQAQVHAAHALLDDPRLASLPSAGETAGLSWQTIARYHHLFGKVLHREIGSLCALLYELDLGITVGNIAREKGFCYARALPMEDNVFQAAGLRHPGLDKAVGNTLAFDGGSNVLFLTGANMAGKSTLMKSFGIAIYLAHMGFPVAADGMVFSVKEGLYSSINVPDDLSLGYSHFYAEVLRVKKVAEAVSGGRNLVVIFDELFKGTNVKDAYDATLSVTEAFAGYKNCFFVISTHIIEVGETLRQRYDSLQFSYLPTVMDGMTPRYPYTMKEGITSDRHGMLIIGNEGILDLLSVKTQSE